MEVVADDWRECFCESDCEGSPAVSPWLTDAGGVCRRGPLLLMLLVLMMLALAVAVTLGVRGVAGEEVDRAYATGMHV